MNHRYMHPMPSARGALFNRANVAFCLFSFLCACFLSPWAERSLGVTAIMAVVGLYLLLETDHLCNVRGSEKTVMLLIALYVGMLLLYTFLRMSERGAGQTRSVLFMLTYILMAPISSRLNRRQCLFIALLCILAVMGTVLQNYLLWERMGHRMTQQWYRRGGVAEVMDTQYVNATILFAGVLFSVFLHCRQRVCRYACLALAALVVLFNLTVTQRAAAMVLSAVMFLALYLFHGKTTASKGVRCVLFLLGGVLFLFGHEFFLNKLADLINSDRITARINSLARLVESAFAPYGEDALYEGSSLGARIRLNMVSIKTFFGSPWNFLFGVGDKLDNLQVGNHCYFFDEFAKFGLFGGVLSCSIIGGMILTGIRNSAVKGNENLSRLLQVLYFIVVLRAVTGGVMATSMGVVINIFAPLVFRLMKQDEAPGFDAGAAR